MSTYPQADEVLIEALRLLKLHKSMLAGAAAAGIPRTTFQSRIYEANRRGLDADSVPGGAVPQGFEVKSLNKQFDADGNLLRQSVGSRPGPGGKFELPAGHVVKGLSVLTDANGQTIAQWTKTRAGEMSPEYWADVIKAAFEGYVPALAFIPEPDADKDLATILPVSDAHFGLYAYGAESGEDYDLKIADETNRATFARLMQATPPSGQAVILGLGDLLHADNPANTTAKSGHALDVDTRHSKVRQTAVMFMIFCVDEAKRRHAKVSVRILPGNHDEVSSGAIALALWAWFRNDDRVTVDIDPSRFWWWRFGQTLLGATHGDMAKMADLPLIMARDRAQDWGATTYRYILSGHIHHKSAMEIGGVIVESFQSTAAKDAWHAGMGFGAGRSMQAITLHSERGEISRSKVAIRA